MTEDTLTGDNELTDQNLNLIKMKDEAEDKYLRLYAEFENYKKRVQKEKEEIRVTTVVRMIDSILDVDNDISIALKNTKDEGVKLISKKIEKFLKSYNIESIQTDIYDVDLHEVVTITGNNNKIIDVISKGYTLNGKPFKYPKVILG